MKISIKKKESEIVKCEISDHNKATITFDIASYSALLLTQDKDDIQYAIATSFFGN